MHNTPEVVPFDQEIGLARRRLRWEFMTRGHFPAPFAAAMVRGADDPTNPHPASTANAEWARRKFQRRIAGRALEHKLVSQIYWTFGPR
jgi:hypothetical protein